MVELAARYGYTMDGGSIIGSEEEYEEESHEQSGEYSHSARSPPQGERGGGSRRATDHRGMKYSDMSKIFEVLVRKIDFEEFYIEQSVLAMNIHLKLFIIAGCQSQSVSNALHCLHGI